MGCVLDALDNTRCCVLTVCARGQFFYIILIMLLAEIAAVVLIYVYRDQVSEMLVSEWNEGVTTNDQTVLNTIELVQAAVRFHARSGERGELILRASSSSAAAS